MAAEPPTLLVPSGESSAAAGAPTDLPPESVAVEAEVRQLKADRDWLRALADDDTIGERERVQARLGAVRCTGKILDIEVAREKLAVALRLDASNRRVEAQLGGQDGGVVRSDSAPPFVVPEGQATH